MIQRKQSIYLLLVGLLNALMLIFPLAGYVGADGVVGEFGVWDFPFFGVLLSLSVVLPVGVIFAYRAREFQLRMCIVEAIFMFGVLAFEVMTVVRLLSVDFAVDFSPVMLAVVPSAIFLWMAYRGILADMALIKSADRIR